MKKLVSDNPFSEGMLELIKIN